MHLIDRLKNTIRDVEGYPKPGIVFKDITPVLADASLVKAVVAEMVARYRDQGIDAIAAIEAGVYSGINPRASVGLQFHTRAKSRKITVQHAEAKVRPRIRYGRNRSTQ